MKLKYNLIFLTYLIIFCNTIISFAQKKEIENINFSKIDFQKVKTTPNYYSNKFILNKDEFLNIHFNLNKPLIESLKSLAPNLTQNQLLNKGNFQFTFLINGKKVYVENLNKGAGSIKSKTTQLKFLIPLLYPKQIDFWGWFMWLKFMKIGSGQDYFSEGNHSLSIQIRPYIKEKKVKVGKIIAQGNIAIKVAKITVDERLIPVQEILPNSGWELSNDKYNHQKIEALNRKIAEKRFENINGIVVIKNNKLLIEEYFNGENRNSLHDARSVGKSFASTLLGIAIDEKHIKNEYAFLKEFYQLKLFKNYTQKKDSITLKSLLTMSSSFLGDDTDYSSPGNEENMYPTKNWLKFSLDLPLHKHKKIGQEFTYFTAGVIILGDIIHKSVPKGLISFADTKLFTPLNITNYKWQYTPQKVGNTAGGIQLRAIDFAKYGQLYKNNGQWKGKQILTKKWVNKSLSKQISQSNAGIKNRHYGYLFWNKTYTVANKQYEVSFANGRGGNKIFIFKNIPYVIVITSSAYNTPNAHSNVDKMMTQYILPAILPN
ncbi:serine hydrolase [Tenacibaculum sp. E3R01]|uniref:serine hydrolase domain-containing protein n=1 Tax=Tenacibaculum sp. E3R01 TaxID=2267227 RepID=UPI000DE95237|nr:serine hydrolase [Tenacibaculum sp. E3R01]RBW57547.1 serine hydrolase [Tenacibaculum sp. E3R01]